VGSVRTLSASAASGMNARLLLRAIPPAPRAWRFTRRMNAPAAPGDRSVPAPGPAPQRRRDLDGAVVVRAVVRDRLLRDRAGGDAVFAGRFAAVRSGGAGGEP